MDGAGMFRRFVEAQVLKESEGTGWERQDVEKKMPVTEMHYCKSEVLLQGTRTGSWKAMMDREREKGGDPF